MSVMKQDDENSNDMEDYEIQAHSDPLFFDQLPKFCFSCDKLL